MPYTLKEAGNEEDLGGVYDRALGGRKDRFYPFGASGGALSPVLRGGQYYLLLCLLRSAGKTDFIEFIKKDHFGRPSFRNYPWLDFNISHTSGIAVCALGDGRRVGIDIERIPVGVDRDRVAERFFSDREKKEYALGGGTEEAFATVWTRMEAYCKYTGLGMEETEPTGKELSALTFLTRMIIIGNREYVLSLCSKKLAGEGEDGVISQFFERIYVMPK